MSGDRWEQFNLIVDAKNLNVKEKGLLLILFRFVNYKSGYANPSRETIKKLYGTKKNDVIDKSMEALIQKGYLVRITDRGRRTKYFIKVGTQIEPSTIIEPGTQIEPRVGTQIEPRVGTQIEPQKEKKKKRKENIYISLKFVDDMIDKVNITQEQYDVLSNKFGADVLHKQILDLDSYIVNGKGENYKDHSKTLNLWCIKSKQHKEVKSIEKRKIEYGL